MQKHLSPWREMPERRESDRRVEYAQIITFLPVVPTLIGLVIAVVALTRGAWSQLAGQDTSWWPYVAIIVMTALYGFAAWRIGRRERLGGIIALTLFAGSIAMAVWQGRLLSFGVGYAVLGIVLVLRAAEELHLRGGAADDE